MVVIGFLLHLLSVKIGVRDFVFIAFWLRVPAVLIDFVCIRLVQIRLGSVKNHVNFGATFKFVYVLSHFYIILGCNTKF